MTLSAGQYRLLIRVLCWSLAAVFLLIALYKHDVSQSAETSSVIGVFCQGQIVENEILHHSETRMDGNTPRTWDMRTSRLQVTYQFNGHDYTGERTLRQLALVRKGSPVELTVDPHNPSRWEFKPGQGQGLDAPPPDKDLAASRRFLFFCFTFVTLCAGYFLPGILAPEEKRGRLDGLD